jgi:hypothetical protein
MVLLGSISSSLYGLLQPLDDYGSASDVADCCRSVGNLLLYFIIHKINYPLLIIILTLGIGIYYVTSRTMAAWRDYTYRKLYATIRRSIDKAVRTVTTGNVQGAFDELVAELKDALGPLADVLAVSTTGSYPWIGDLNALLNKDAVKWHLDLSLLQARWCYANDCAHLGSPHTHTLKLSGNEPNNPAHHVTTIQQPGTRPVTAVPAAITWTGSGTHTAPAQFGQSYVIAELDIGGIAKDTRIICDCRKSKPREDLVKLTGSTAPAPPVPAPPNPVLLNPFNGTDWYGLAKRAPNAAEEQTFRRAKIVNLHNNWTEDNVLNFLRALYKAMHKHR